MESENNPLVSIIVIAYNSAKFVLETLESAKDQTYQNIELIVSDDGSTDNTIEICKEWIEKNKERFVRTELIAHPVNTGIPANCNRGVKAAKGEWVKLIAGDDVLIPNCIELYINEIKKNNNISFLHSNVYRYENEFTDENKQPSINTKHYKINSEHIEASEQFQILLRRNFIWACSVFIKKSVFVEVGYFDENIKLWEDLPMWLKITSNGIRLHYVDIYSSKYRINNKSIIQNKKKDKLFSDFIIERSRYYFENYLIYLPIIERIAKGYILFVQIFLEKIYLNKNYFFIRQFVKIITRPSVLYLKRIAKKYI